MCALIVLAACTTPPPEPARVAVAPIAPVPAAAAASVTARSGIDASGVNRGVDPCTDFYEFANGTWRAQNPIPAGKPRWGRRDVSRQANRLKVRALLEELAAKSELPAGSAAQLAGDLYASCMDEAAIDAAGLAPLAPLLADIDAARTPADVQRAIRRLHDLGIAAPFGETGAFDNQQPEDFLLDVVAGGLGLADREAYAKPALRAAYSRHVARVLALSGISASATVAAADDVVALEKRLADASLDPKTAADPAATDHPTTFAQLHALAPHVDWDLYFDEAKIPRGRVNVAEPKFLQQVDKELATTPVRTWKAYLRWRLLEAASPWLSRPFVEEAFAADDKALGGATATTPRGERCADLTETLLGEPVGRIYAERYFTPAAKAKARAIADRLRAVLTEEIAGLSWMTAGTKQKALEKLATMSIQVGYPDTWKDLASVHVRRDALWANIAQALAFSVDDVRRQMGKPTDRAGWLLPPSSPAAYIDLQLGELVLPAGFLQPPYFDPDATDAANYGAFGAGLAHDMTHAFDATGSVLDALGRARPWWSDADRSEFAKRTQCLVDQYEGYAIEPGVHHDGKRVLDEALGDQAGIHVAYVALEQALATTHPGPRIDGFTPEQQFFLAWGQFRGEAMRIETQRDLVKGDIHPMPKFRVIGPLSNTLEFARAFSCAAGTAMVRPPERRCAVW
jgi:endothelin-converting enzyme/putative endopeptidase